MPINLAAEHEKLVACLEELAAERTRDGLPTIAVFDGKVPGDLDSDDAGRVFPYAVVWGSVGDRPPWAERAVTDVGTRDLRWTPQITVGAGYPAWVLDGMQLVRDALDVFRTEGGSPLLEADGVDRKVREDPDDSRGTRFYAVLPLESLLPA